MSAHVFQYPNSGEPNIWQVKCYDHGNIVWLPPEDHPHTDAGLTKAFADRDKHNRVEHPEDV